MSSYLNFLKCTGKGRMVAVLGTLANWYSNGNEIPVDKDEALAFRKQNWQTFVTYALKSQIMVDDERLRPTNLFNGTE